MGVLMLLCPPAAAEQPDLNISAPISVNHTYFIGAWANLSNTVNVTVRNIGTAGVGSFNVALYADGAEVGTKSVSSLAAGANTTVSFDWTPYEVKTYTLWAVADPENVIAESNETNNDRTRLQLVRYNGFMGDKPFTTCAHDTIKGNLFYTVGDSRYSGELVHGNTYTVNHTVTIPGGATVKFARLYNYWTWSYYHSNYTGKYPIMNLTFDGIEISPEATYDDRKGWGFYNFPTGTWAYNVTTLVTGSGSHTAVVRNIDTDAFAYFCMDGIGLLVVYEDPNGKVVEYWINEGADMVSTMHTSGGLTPQEATARSLFSGSINLSRVESARLWTVVQSGSHLGTKLIFNNKNWTGVYDGSPYNDLDIDEQDVKEHLVSTNNTAKIEPPDISDNSGDYLVPSNAFLVINYTPPVPDFSISVSPNSASVVQGSSASATVTLTSILGYDTNVTLGASGILNATISFTPEKGKPTYTSAMLVSTSNTTPAGSYPLNITGTGDGKVRSTIFTLTVTTTRIIPAIAIEVTPSSINFGDLSPGQTSSGKNLTVKNRGGYSINVSAEVTDSAENLFVDGVLLNESLWNLYSAVIPRNGSDKPVAKLRVPEDYAGMGPKEGVMMFWAQKS